MNFVMVRTLMGQIRLRAVGLRRKSYKTITLNVDHQVKIVYLDRIDLRLIQLELPTASTMEIVQQHFNMYVFPGE